MNGPREGALQVTSRAQASRCRNRRERPLISGSLLTTLRCRRCLDEILGRWVRTA